MSNLIRPSTGPGSGIIIQNSDAVLTSPANSLMEETKDHVKCDPISLDGQQSEWSRNVNDKNLEAEESRPWKTTLIRFRPLSGLFCLLLAALSLLASLGILAGSNNEPIKDWSTTPSTYVAIFTAIGNLAMRYAAFQGVIVAWWVKALKGSSIKMLQENWRAGTSIRGAIIAGRHMGWLGLASIFSTLVIIDGPLLQRSTSVVQAPYVNSTLPLDVIITPELPTGYTGQWANSHLIFGNEKPWAEAWNDTAPAPEGTISNHIWSSFRNSLLQADGNHWYSNAPFPNLVHGCPRTCTAAIRAPALAATSCISKSIDTSYTSPGNFSGARAVAIDKLAFVIATALDVRGEREKINVITGYSTSKDCTGVLNLTVCSLESAIGEYDVTIADDVTTLDSPANPRIVALSNNALTDHSINENGYHPSTLGGIVAQAYMRWEGNAKYVNISGTIQTITLNGSPSLFMEAQQPTLCRDFRDPLEEYMASINTLMVWSGFFAAQGLNQPDYESLDPGNKPNITVTGFRKGNHNVFHTDYWFFMGAAIIEVVCICLVAPTYWGWWKIGRIVSFSPFEFAKAFDTPMFADANSNATGNDIARMFGDRHIKYGVTWRGTNRSSSKLTFTSLEEAEYPERGMLMNS